MRVTGILLLGLIGFAGCAPPASQGDFNSPDPASKLYAIHRAGEAEDRQAVGNLIEQLESDDPAVRMYAIGALERITGRRYGFVPYDPVHVRKEAVDRWVEAYRSGALGSARAEGSNEQP